jgi:hypothetical protein
MWLTSSAKHCGSTSTLRFSIFVTEEIASLPVEHETWRRLKVTFPDEVKSHTREQISCFGPDGLLRRHDYTVLGFASHRVR